MSELKVFFSSVMWNVNFQHFCYTTPLEKKLENVSIIIWLYTVFTLNVIDGFNVVFCLFCFRLYTFYSICIKKALIIFHFKILFKKKYEKKVIFPKHISLFQFYYTRNEIWKCASVIRVYKSMMFSYDSAKINMFRRRK